MALLFIGKKPKSIFEDFFDVHPEDFWDPWHYSPLVAKIKNKKCERHHKCAPTTVDKKDKDSFRVCMDVQQFTPEEIMVKTVGRDIVVEAKHEEQEDEHGTIFRHFVRRYTLPDEYRIEDVESKLSSDGILSIAAPLFKSIENKNEREVPITRTGPAHTTLQRSQKKDADTENKMESD